MNDTDITTPEGRAELRRLRAIATEGEWAIWHDLKHQGYVTVGDEGGVLSDEKPSTEECNPVAHVYTTNDAELMVAAVNALPALLDALDATCNRLVAAENTIEELRTQVTAYRQTYERDLPYNSGTSGIMGLIHRAERAEKALVERERLAETSRRRELNAEARAAAAEEVLDKVRELAQEHRDLAEYHHKAAISYIGRIYGDVADSLKDILSTPNAPQPQETGQ